MPTFTYVAKDQTGKIVKSSSEAENEKILVKRLREQGYWVTGVKRARGAAAAKEGAPAKKPLISFGRVKLGDLTIFCRQFATMINAGVSLVRCLAVLENQSTNVKLKEIIREIQTQVEGGATLSKSLMKFPKVFSNLFMGLIRAGEVGGVLDETLERLAGFLEADMNLRRKIKSAMTYPVLVLFVATGIVLFLMTFILPKFMQLFEELGIGEDKMPAMTIMLKHMSDFLLKRWYLVLAGVIAFSMAFKAYTNTKMGKRQWDWVKLRVPVFGKLNHKISVARFARTLSTLLTSGVPILQAMETVAGAVGNEILQEAILNARTAIREGERIGDPLEKSGLFPPMVVQMISIGEETGALDQMLSKIADFYEQEVEATLESLAAALEPIMIVILGFIVGFIVIAMFLPLIAVINQLSGES